MNENHFSWLLVALLIFLVGVPVADDLMILRTPAVRILLYSCLVLIGIWSLKGYRRFYLVGMSFAIVGVLTHSFAAGQDSMTLMILSFAALFGFLITAVLCALRQIAVGTEINANRLIGAVSVYLMLGVLWSIIYSVVTWLAPGAIAGLSEQAHHGFDSAIIYFSFVTMTTLGYGDIIPISATARGLAYMQAVVGQFYLAILVAGLVSAYITKRKLSHGSD